MSEIYSSDDGNHTPITDAEKLDYVYNFCRKLEMVFDAFESSPAMKMFPGMSKAMSARKDD